MPVKFDELESAYEFVSASGGFGSNEAFLCRRSGTIYWRSDPLVTGIEEELPDDIEDDEKYIAIPDKRELDLGKPLVLDFAREFLPDDYGDVHYIFSKRGAYGKFKALLVQRGALDRWYKFESEATKRALRDWCKVNEIEVEG